jgi:hypothetical protein
MKGGFKKFIDQASHVHIKPFKTKPLSAFLIWRHSLFNYGVGHTLVPNVLYIVISKNWCKNLINNLGRTEILRYE